MTTDPVTRSVEIPDKFEARVRDVEEATWERVQAEREAAEQAFEVADQDYRMFVIARAFRGGWKPWEICGAIDLMGGEDDPVCQLPKKHPGRWHQEWASNGRLLGEWS